jgi:hypothetical protein
MDWNVISNFAEIVNIIAGIADIIVKVTVVIAAILGIYKFIEYRELKKRIQFDIEAKIYKLSLEENVQSFTWDENGEHKTTDREKHTHALEVLMKFTNKGFTRIRIFNIQIGVNTMRPHNEAKFSEEDGHLHLKRLFTSGNIVPIYKIDGKPVNKTSFYFIEPSVEQTITYLILIKEPRELLQVFAQFNFEQRRIFPFKDTGHKKLYPHISARTYMLNSNNTVHI